MSKKSMDYQEYLIDSLKEPEEARGYLNAALEGGEVDVFLRALQNVVKAQRGLRKLAEETNKSRTSLYKALSEEGNPHLKSISDILSVMGLHLAIVANQRIKHIKGRYAKRT